MTINPETDAMDPDRLCSKWMSAKDEMGNVLSFATFSLRTLEVFDLVVLYSTTACYNNVHPATQRFKNIINDHEAHRRAYNHDDMMHELKQKLLHPNLRDVVLPALPPQRH